MPAGVRGEDILGSVEFSFASFKQSRPTDSIIDWKNSTLSVSSWSRVTGVFGRPDIEIELIAVIAKRNQENL